MGTTTVSVSLSLDSAGFMSQECPACERIFKVQPGQGSSKPVRHCPYCNHEGDDCWWTKAQVEYIHAYGASKVLGPEIEKMARDINRTGRGSVTMKPGRMPVPRAPLETDDAMPTASFECCGETIRHDGQSARLHCPICGAQPT